MHTGKGKGGRNNLPPAKNRAPKPLPTRAAARQGSRRNIKVLRRHAKEDPGATALAEYLARCRFRHPCNSGACERCMRRLQRAFVTMIASTMEESGGNLTRVTIVPSGLSFSPGSLKAPFAPLRAQLHEALTSAGIDMALGGFDISFNEDEAGRFRPGFKPHAVLFIERSAKLAQQRKVLRAKFLASPSVPKPLIWQSYDGHDAGSAYAMKINFDRRVKFREAQGKGRRTTRKRPVRAADKVELMMILHEVGLGNRLFVHGPKGQAGLKLKGSNSGSYGRSKPMIGRASGKAAVRQK